MKYLSSIWLLAGMVLALSCGGEMGKTPAPPESNPKASSKPVRPVKELANTHWQLVKLQSMADPIGVKSVFGPTKYTMSLNADGTVNFQLDCNRGDGTWSAEPSADGESGSLTFGPLATTRAFCPPPSLGDQLGREAEYVRSYLLKDGRLYLSLMADGGIQVWEPRVVESAD